MFYSRRHRSISSSKSQQGIVLLAAILVVMVATGIIVSITHAEAFSIRKTGRIQVLERASAYAFGLEDWARLILRRDREDSTTDDYSEDWAIGVPGLPIDGGYLSGSMQDEQGKININDILTSAETLARLRALCDNLEDVNTDFIDALIDWIDADPDITFPNGHEYAYETYRVANRPLSDISELMLIKNMKAEMYQKLLPYITVLPTPTSININTIIEKQVFLSLDATLQDADFDRYVDELADDPFVDVPSFITRLQLTMPETGLSVSTNYFRAIGTINQGDQSVNFNTLIHRDSTGATTILNRTLGGV